MTDTENQDETKKIEPEFNGKSLYNLFKKGKIKYIYYFIICTLPVFTSYYFYDYALTKNHFLSFPLDDSWIHLTFAKNIAEYFSFSYYKNEIVTAGSTSPLYTLVVALGFLLTKNEMILSYVLGVIFFIFASFYFYKLSLKEFNTDFIFCLLCTAILIFDPWINFIALSGMETTLFIFLLILGSYLYKTKKVIPLGVVLGLILWTRPDGLAFVAAIFADYFILRFIIKEKDKSISFSGKEIFTVFFIFTGFAILYFSMNLYLSGTVLPNTYSAKIAFFIDTESRMEFLTGKVWPYFTSGSYGLMMSGFIFSIFIFVYNILRRNYDQNSLYIIFIIIFLFIYWLKLPAANRFGRYMMPLIPFFLLVSLLGFKSLFNLMNTYIKKPVIFKTLSYLIIVFILFFTFKDFNESKENYAVQSKHIYERQVQTAKWLSENTIEGDIIATHDIGAIGFYSGRKIVDVAGLITPELNAKLNEENYSDIMTQYMKDNGVTYTVFLRDWYVLANQNSIYTAPADSRVEILDVNRFDPKTSRVLSKQAHRKFMKVMKFIYNRNGQMIVSTMNNVLEIEPEYSMAYYTRAYGYSLLKDYDNYEKDLQKAILYFPDFKEALLDYGLYLRKNDKEEEARMYFLKVLKLDPSNKIALENLN